MSTSVDNLRTRLDNLRTLFRKYGDLRGTLTPMFKSRAQSLRVKLRITLVGKFAPTTMRGYLALVYLFPPDFVDIALRKHEGDYHHNPRPAVTCEWQGQKAILLLAAVGWKVGKPSFDKKALALKRWLAYRKSSGAYWRDRA